jgi:pyruvate kinase
MPFSEIVTVGPSLLSNFETLKTIDSLGDCIYRLNGAHMTPDAVEEYVGYLRWALGNCSIMIDLPCNKIRTANLNSPIILEKEQRFQLRSGQASHHGFFELLRPGDVITAMDSVLRMEVVGVEEDRITLISHSDGMLGNNKGLHFQGTKKSLPYLFDRDLGLIRKASELGAAYLSLSYVRTRTDMIR